ncbi:MAG: hypothetical protein WCG95_06630 [bacterium]
MAGTGIPNWNANTKSIVFLDDGFNKLPNNESQTLANSLSGTGDKQAIIRAKEIVTNINSDHNFNQPPIGYMDANGVTVTPDGTQITDPGVFIDNVLMPRVVKPLATKFGKQVLSNLGIEPKAIFTSLKNNIGIGNHTEGNTAPMENNTYEVPKHPKAGFAIGGGGLYYGLPTRKIGVNTEKIWVNLSNNTPESSFTIYGQYRYRGNSKGEAAVTANYSF